MRSRSGGCLVVAKRGVSWRAYLRKERRGDREKERDMGVLVYGGLQGIWWAGKGRQARAISGSPFIYPLNTGTKDHLARC